MEQSLRRLKTDRLDLVQVHMSLQAEEVLESNGTIETMSALRDEGKVRFIGMSGTIPNLADHIAMDVFDVFQIPYSALQREHEGDLISAAVDAGAGTLIRGGAARGAAAEDKEVEHQPDRIERRRRQVVALGHAADLDDLLGEMSSIEFILRFTLSHPGLSSTIVGTSKPEHLASNLAMAEKGPLPGDVYRGGEAPAPRRSGVVATPATPMLQPRTSGGSKNARRVRGGCRSSVGRGVLAHRSSVGSRKRCPAHTPDRWSIAIVQRCRSTLIAQRRANATPIWLTGGARSDLARFNDERVVIATP